MLSNIKEAESQHRAQSCKTATSVASPTSEQSEHVLWWHSGVGRPGSKVWKAWKQTWCTEKDSSQNEAKRSACITTWLLQQDNAKPPSKHISIESGLNYDKGGLRPSNASNAICNNNNLLKLPIFVAFVSQKQVQKRGDATFLPKTIFCFCCITLFFFYLHFKTFLETGLQKVRSFCRFTLKGPLEV